MWEKYTKFYKVFISKYKKQQVIGVIILLIYSFFNMIYPLFIEPIIDEAIFRKDLKKLIFYISCMTFSLVFTILFRYIKTIYFLRVGQRVTYELRKGIVHKLFYYNNNFYRKYQAAELTTILNQDVSIVQRVYINIFNNVISNVVTFVGLCAIIFSLNYVIAIVTLTVTGIYLIIQKKYGHLIKKSFYEISKGTATFNQYMQEMLDHMKDIVVLGQIDFFLNRYSDKQNEIYKKILQGTKIREKAFVMDGIFEGINLILVLCIGGYMAIEGEFSIGALFTLTLYVQRVFAPIVSLMNDYMEMKKAEASIDRINEVYYDSNIIRQSENILFDDKYDINIEKFKFGYNQDVLIGTNYLSIKEKDKVVVLGKNGSGKSTFFNILMKLETDYEGYISIGNNDLKELNVDNFFNNCIYVGQKPFIFEGTLEENLTFNGANMDDYENAFRKVGFWEDFLHFPDGMECKIGGENVNLSGGQAQKIVLARLFMLSKRKIIILDEPTASLDITSEEIVLDSIFKTFKDSTIIVITHRLKVKEYCNKIINIDNGVISIQENDTYNKSK